MLILRVFLSLLFFAFSEQNSFYSKLSSDLQRLNTPGDFGRFLEDQLARNESRFITRQCFQHLKEYAKGLLTFRIWAIKMFDSHAKFPTGLLRGHAASLGAFDQCIGIRVNNERFGTINGKYCLGMVNLIKMSSSKSNRMDFSDDVIMPEPEPRLVSLAKGAFGLPWGVCLPDSCSAKDFQILHLWFFLKFDENDCQTETSEYRTFDGGDIGTLVFLGVIAGLIAGSTLYESIRYYSGKGKGSALLRSFSILTNGSKVLRKEENLETSCLYGIKCVNLIIIILGYRYVLHLFIPLNNWLNVAWWVSNNYIAFEAVIILDTYFVISGMLISYNYLKSKERGVKFNIIFYYLNRIIRFTIPLAVVILIHVTLLRHIGSGPILARSRDPLFVKSCQKNWWTSLLYIQNYAHPYIANMCVLQAWHLSADMQLFILSPLFLLPLMKHPKYVISTSLIVLILAVITNFLMVWVHSIKALVLTFRSLRDIMNYIKYMFLPTHLRVAPWIIGLILGYVIFKSKDIKLPVKKVFIALIVVILWVISLTIIVMSIMVGNEFEGVKYNWLMHAFYVALIHPLWSIAISWIIFACTQGYAGPVNSILSAHIFQVISRISYGTCIVSFTLMSLLTFQTRKGVDFSDYEAIYKGFSDFLLCLGLGFVWTISFEYPFVTIAKVIFRMFESGNTKEEEVKY